ncbi:hypothetical protein [Bacillus tuaregi]|uniref:hypothetical protein n=1 Tax=Bacillus tuaregi TaxID=1816695 RepID=UPI0008F84770|nr:hypothetical protein [Bacillus tuaregi]
MNIPKQRVDLYFITRKKAFKQPIIIEFFKRETNRELLERIIKEPTLDNTQRLDSEFRLFYKKPK